MSDPSRFSGAQHKGAVRELRVARRAEAEARNLLTPPERRKNLARRMLAAIFTEESDEPS